MLQKPGEKPALLMTVTALGDRFSPASFPIELRNDL